MGIKMKIGLESQGHLGTVESMLKDGKSWDEIGRAIGWIGYAAKDWYVRHHQDKGNHLITTHKP